VLSSLFVEEAVAVQQHLAQSVTGHDRCATTSYYSARFKAFNKPSSIEFYSPFSARLAATMALVWRPLQLVDGSTNTFLYQPFLGAFDIVKQPIRFEVLYTQTNYKIFFQTKEDHGDVVFSSVDLFAEVDVPFVAGPFPRPEISRMSTDD